MVLTEATHRKTFSSGEPPPTGSDEPRSRPSIASSPLSRLSLGRRIVRFLQSTTTTRARNNRELSPPIERDHHEKLLIIIAEP